MFPGFDKRILEAVIDSGARGIVLEAFGVGNIPNGEALAPVLNAANERGIVIVVTSQCGKGKVTLGAYRAGRELLESGVVGGLDITTEAAVTKLYYLFSKYSDIEKIKELMACDLRGEMSGDR